MQKVNHTERAHALLAPSGASRWLNCTPSARLSEQFEDTTSTAAEEGTLAHEFAEWALKLLTKQCTASQRRTAISKLKKNPLFADDMEPAVKVYRDYVAMQINAGVDLILIEEKFDISRYVPECSGLGDCGLVSENKLELIDYKHGKGLKVSAKNNPQLRLYALGLLDQMSLMYDIKTVKMTVVQPRLDNIDSETLTTEELLSWANNEVVEKAKEAFAGTGETKAGDWCIFCKAKPKCKTIHKEIIESAKSDFSDPRLVGNDKLSELYEMFTRAEANIKSIKTYMLGAALKGVNFKGLKVVEGKANRYITEPNTVIELLKEDHKPEEYINAKLKGLGDLEKLLTKKGFNEKLGHLVDKPRGAPTLVKDSDKRTPYNSAAADFGQ